MTAEATGVRAASPCYSKPAAADPFRTHDAPVAQTVTHRNDGLHGKVDDPGAQALGGDQGVPYSQSEHLAAALHAYGVRCDLYPVPGAGHVFQGAPDAAA
ncbi:hypothetical protein RB614_36805 [Phytohabitans sp. ZYX-F-186]|uniref:Peptidase S9 prolyl oligopeptidase catalytic domain-containing protein n=1 Tax=Phytohabitans maris TaxID=3071409 RepID=A0ABU0ZSY7_9ACTN|nr:hypothetical protein [Phytohabitans sp. ZYX-F-186]MDQ7910073.1 hypothetical protein [Phytohabitans sp. ZYX-F-186]